MAKRQATVLSATKPKVFPAEADAFVQQAVADPSAPEKTPAPATLPGADHATPSSELPWETEAARVRADVKRNFNVRLPEPYLLRLQWLAERLPRSKSMHQILLDILLPGLDAMVVERIEIEQSE